MPGMELALGFGERKMQSLFSFSLLGKKEYFADREKRVDLKKILYKNIYTGQCENIILNQGTELAVEILDPSAL